MTDVIDRVRPAERGAAALGYYLSIIGATAIAVTIVDTPMAPTFLWTIVGWGVVSVIASPGRGAAGRGFFLAVTTALLARDYSGLDLDARLWAFANLAVLLSVFRLIPLNKTRTFPFVQVWCLVESIYIYVSSLIASPTASFQYVFTPEVRTSGYRILFVFNVVFVVAALGTNRIAQGTRAARTLPPLLAPPASAIGRAYALIIVSVGMIAVSSVANLADRLGSLNQVLQLIGYGGGLILVMLWLDGRLPLRHKVALAAMAGGVALFGLGTGALYFSATPGFLVLSLFLAQKRRVPWTAMLAVLSILLLLNMNKGEFRQETWYGQSDETSTTLGLDWIQKTTSDLDEASDERISHSAYRFANSDLLGYIATYVPDRYDYFGYDAFTSVPYVLLPRVLLPDKPKFNLENQFGRQYELIGRADFNTTVNTPLHVESYVAGGLLPMLLVALFSGFYLVLVGAFLKTTSAPSVLVGCLLSYSVILTIESGILGFVLLLPFALILYPFMWWACRPNRLEDYRVAQLRRRGSPRGDG